MRDSGDDDSHDIGDSESIGMRTAVACSLTSDLILVRTTAFSP